jgi:hypothetical protein
VIVLALTRCTITRCIIECCPVSDPCTVSERQSKEAIPSLSELPKSTLVLENKKTRSKVRLFPGCQASSRFPHIPR